LIKEVKFMLNAPSNNKNTNVNVVNTGAMSARLAGVTYPKEKGPKIKPRIIKNKTSGTLNLRKNHSAKKPKNRIRLIANKINVTTSIVLESHYCFIYITEK